MKRILALLVLVSCVATENNNSFMASSCDFELSLNISQNKPTFFYNSSGSEVWKWKNDSVKNIECYFKTDSFKAGMVKIKEVIILTGTEESAPWALEFSTDFNSELILKLTNSWIKISDCYTELREWMIYGNYSGKHTPYIYETPDTLSAKTLFDPIPTWDKNSINIIALKDDWAYIELVLDKESTVGWVPRFSLCSHPYTTCN